METRGQGLSFLASGLSELRVGGLSRFGGRPRFIKCDWKLFREGEAPAELAACPSAEVGQECPTYIILLVIPLGMPVAAGRNFGWPLCEL